MDLTQMEWPLLLLGFSVPFSSILFVQYPEISNPVKRVLKALKTACLLRRVPCSHLFLLNGEHSCGRLNQKWGHRTRFVPIPDPVDLSTRPEPSWPQSPTPDRLRFLYFGTISNHKGFDLLVEAMLRLSTDDVNASLFVISGKPYEPKAFEETVDKLRNAPNQVRFELNTSFLPETEMLKVFYESDVVLLPYRRAEYSSGVLGLSAMTGRPVIGPDSGLMGRIIREHRLGKTIDLSAGNLAEAISHTIQNGIDYDPAQGMRYASHCSPRMFSRHILDHLKDKIATPGPVPHAPPDTKKDFFHA
jgi:glycosyltransferase involved in cell wall biosynthesis